MFRQPITIVMGHVDSGKTSLLDWIRGTAIVKSEPGAITQTISSTNLPIETLKKIMGPLVEQLKFKITIPGILLIDSPGHAAFNNLRKRGGNLADLAILVVNIIEGIKEQTLECIQILKQYKTPFIIALNKIDLLSGYHSENTFLLENIAKQTERVKQELDKRLYDLVGKFAELGLNTERFDRVQDYTKQIAMVPTSAITGEGIKELLMVMTGLAQKYLEKDLEITDQKGKATILEVKEEKGLGVTLDLILYDGIMKKNDLVVIGTLDKPLETKIRTLFLPDIKGKYKPIDSVSAAIGIKISAPDVKEVIPGMPVLVTTPSTKKEDIEKIKKEVSEVLLEVDKEGVIVKAESLGSLEALIGLLKEQKILIKKASIGNITKKDLADAKAEEDILNKTILGFNVKADYTDPEVKIIAICIPIIIIVYTIKTILILYKSIL